MKIVVTGGIGSGKSSAVEMLSNYSQIEAINIDTIVADLYVDRDICDQLQKMFGTSIKANISDIVFADKVKRLRLEAFFAKKVSIKLKELMEQHEDLIVEFPLYFEKGQSMFHLFDKVVSVIASKEDRLERVMRRNEFYEDKILTIMDLQVSDDFRIMKSDYIIENNGTVAELRRNVLDVWSRLIPSRAEKLTKIKSGSEVLNEIFGFDDPDDNMLMLNAAVRIKRLSAKQKKIGIVSGSLDPITLGHLWIIEQALALVDEVIVVIALNPTKKHLFSADERVDMVKGTIAEKLTAEQLSRIKVDFLPERELLVSYAATQGAKFIFRGIRNFADFEGENQLNLIQKKIAPGIETIFLMPPREIIEISSSLVKSALAFNDWSNIAKPYVSACVFEQLSKLAVTVDPK